MIACHRAVISVERLVPGDRHEPTRALGAVPPERRRQPLRRVHQLGVAIDLGAGKAGRIGLVRVALDAHHPVVLDMGKQGTHVGAIMGAGNADDFHRLFLFTARRGV